MEKHINLKYNKKEIILSGEIIMPECKKLTKKQIQLIRDKIGKNVLISIGINEYKNVNDNLDICEKDARDIYRCFASNEKLSFVKEQSVLLDSKEKTTLKVVLEQLAILCEKSQGDMNLILFFSGHGVNVDGEFNFILSDSEPNQPNTLLAIGRVIEMLNESRFKCGLILIDACQTIFRGRKSIEDESFANQKKYILGSKGISIIYSCAVGEHSQENVSSFQNSVFTYQLIEAFNGKKDALEGHYLSASSLYKYVTIESQEKSSAYQQVNQHPHLYFDGSNDIYIALLDEDAAKMVGEENKCIVHVNERTSIFQEEEFLGKLICKLETPKWDLLQTLVAELIYNIYKNNEKVNCDIQITRDSIKLVDNGKAFNPTSIVGIYDKTSCRGMGAEFLEKVKTEISGVEYCYEYCNGKNNFKIQFSEQVFVIDKMCIITVDIRGMHDEVINIPNVISEYYYYYVPKRGMAISQCRDISRRVLEELPDGSKLVVIDNSGAPESIIRALKIDGRLIYSSY